MGFSAYIIYLFNFLLGIGAVLAFIIMASAGVKLVQSQGNPSEIAGAKQKIINCFIGLAVLLTSYILLTTINPNIINIQNINLGTTGITISVITPVSEVVEVKNYEFEEIPLGTITEGILIGTSSKKNKVPCYEYEQRAYDSNGNLIIGNTVDKNGDGVIDENDILLNKDMFYCIKLLDDAIKQKIEVHLKTLIAGANQLDNLMKTNCTCERSYHDSFAPNYPYDGEIFSGGPKCYCPYGRSYCRCCGSRYGCVAAPTNPYDVVGDIGDGKEFKQYKYDTCANRLAIVCKSQEIKELMDGTKPDKICYDKNYIDQKALFNLLNIKEAIDRLDGFKEYYDNQVAKLEQAEAKMKDPYGERVSAAEVYNNIEIKDELAVIKNKFSESEYDIARYCRDLNACVDSEDGVKTCSFNSEKRLCKMEGSQEYYSYAGDGATFYYSTKYNKDYEGETQVIDQNDNGCSIETKNINKEMYGGLIRIGETVDYTEAWGKEVSKRIENLKSEVQGMYSVGMAVYNFPDSCNSGNCTNRSSNKYNVCISPSCASNGECSCATVSINSCQECEPIETICAVKEIDGVCLRKEQSSYMGCSSCCRSCPDVEQVQEKYWTCPYRNLCNLMKDLYQERVVERSCYEEAINGTETSLRVTSMKKVGYVQKMKEREAMLFELASVGEIKDDNSYETIATADLIPLICPGYMVPDNYDDLKCDKDLSAESNIESRFILFDMLKTSRESLTGCVKGYNYPYKQTADNMRILSCYELNNSDLVIDFSSFDKSKEIPPYFNCYPYNSNNLDAMQKKDCFDNINNTGLESNPGCLMVTKNYMDNYYCCQ